VERTPESSRERPLLRLLPETARATGRAMCVGIAAGSPHSPQTAQTVQTDCHRTGTPGYSLSPASSPVSS
jgi:hypothetical protein